MSEFIYKIQKVLEDSKTSGKSLNLAIDGLSGDGLVGFLQRAVDLHSKNKDEIYLEIGVFKGYTLTSVSACNPTVACFGVDNYSKYDEEGINKKTATSRAEEFSSGNVTFIDDDFEEALLNLDTFVGKRTIGTYFIDGPHDYRSQYLCLDYAKRYLSDDCVIIVDDSNYEHVRHANSDWLKANPEFKLLFQSYTNCHPNYMSDDEMKDAKLGWWDGVNIIVRDKDNVLELQYPPVDESRIRFINDHLIHSSKYAEYAPELLSIAT